MLRVLENNVPLCLSAGLKSALRGVACLQVVHASAATEVGGGVAKYRAAAAGIIGLRVSA